MYLVWQFHENMVKFPSCFVVYLNIKRKKNQLGNDIKFLWPSQNIRTLMIQFQVTYKLKKEEDILKWIEFWHHG